MKYVFINVTGLAVVFAVLVVGFVVIRAVAGQGDAATMTPDGRFPDFVYSSPESLAAYQLAAKNRGLFSQLPCYCGCADLRPKAHEDLDDCFFDSRGAVDSHAAGCALCQDIARDAAAWRTEGDSAFVIRYKVDSKYEGSGPATDTPPVTP